MAKIPMNRCTVILVWIVISTAARVHAAERETHSIDDILRESARAGDMISQCGPIALSRLLYRHGIPADTEELLRSFKTRTAEGVQIGEILRIAREHELSCQALRFQQLRDLSTRMPAVLLVNDGRHCVVLENLGKDVATIWDPGPMDEVRVPMTVLSGIWNGEAIIVQPARADSGRLATSLLAGSLTFLCFVLLRIAMPRKRDSVELGETRATVR